jgi:NitT/TauT family transport system substrate-binding protein
MVKMKKWQVPLFFLLAGLHLGWSSHGRAEVKMAVEFNNHAAPTYIAQAKGWFEEEGIESVAYEDYVTGMARAAAMARGDIQVAFICLVPAITAYTNANVPIRIIAGTHKRGYGLVGDPRKIKAIEDLQGRNIRIGCVREGGATDVFLQKVIDTYQLDRATILPKIRRMNPPKQVLAVRLGQLDAAVLPEHHASMVEGFGFKMILTGMDVWPSMQGSVLAVKENLMRERPELVQRLLRVCKRATRWINDHPDEAAELVARRLQITSKKVFPLDNALTDGQYDITPQDMARSMSRLYYSTAIDPKTVQETIDYLLALGYIGRQIRAEDILDLRYLR